MKPPHKWMMSVAAILLVGCKSSPAEPDLNATITWMGNALARHNGQRLDSTISKDVKLINELTVDHCQLTYELSNLETIQYDLSDIDTKTLKLETIGQSTWVAFSTRDYHHSVRYIDARNQKLEYDSETGGFSLDSQEVATSFSKALERAAKLCGSKPSTF